MLDLAIREMKNSIINYINNNPLPIEVKRMVINEISSEIKEKADEVIREQVIERDKAKENSDGN